jgi:hypothetical protein
LKDDVEETLCWGLDLYTRKNVFYILPEDCTDEERNDFISNSLMKAINLQREEGYDMLRACNFIL